MQVEFSELASAYLVQRFKDESQRQSAVNSIRWYLVRRGVELSRPCPAFDDVALYIYPLGELRVLWEASNPIVVWSISLRATSR